MKTKEQMLTAQKKEGQVCGKVGHSGKIQTYPDLGIWPPSMVTFHIFILELCKQILSLKTPQADRLRGFLKAKLTKKQKNQSLIPFALRSSKAGLGASRRGWVFTSFITSSTALMS